MRTIKKTLAIILSLVMLLGVMPFAVNAAETVPASVKVGTVTLASGKSLAKGSTTPSDIKPIKNYAYYENGVLTLNGFSLSGTSFGMGGVNQAMIAADGSIDIVLIGTNTLNDANADYGIYASENIDFSAVGNGSLKIDVGVDGIRADGKVTIKSGSYDINATENGIYGKTGVIVSGQSLDINVPNGNGFASKNNIAVSGGDIIIAAKDGIFSDGYQVYLESGNINIKATRYALNASYSFIISGTVTLSGGTCAVYNQYSEFDGIIMYDPDNFAPEAIVVSENIDGSNPTEFDSSKGNSYKYIGMSSYEHTISVVDGTADVSRAITGHIVNLTADAPPVGMVFDKWVFTNENGVVVTVNIVDETAKSTVLFMTNINIIATATYKHDGITPMYKVNLTDATADFATAAEGQEVSIVAAKPAHGKMFDKWVITAKNGSTVSVAGETSAATVFVMPASAVSVTATYKEAPTYSITVNGGESNSDSGYTDDEIDIYADAVPVGKAFDYWSASNAVIASYKNKNTKITIGSGDVEVTAHYKDATLKVTDVVMTDGSYLVGGAVETTTEKPGDSGYAYYKDGVLYLNSFVYDGSASDVIVCDGSINIVIEGENKVDLYNATSFATVNGNVNFTGGNDDSLTFIGCNEGIVSEYDVVINGGKYNLESKSYVINATKFDLLEGQFAGAATDMVNDDGLSFVINAHTEFTTELKTVASKESSGLNPVDYDAAKNHEYDYVRIWNPVEISEVTLSVNEPVAGDEYTVLFASTTGTDYTASVTRWYINDGNETNFSYFEPATEYCAEIIVYPLGINCFTDSTSVLLNGNTVTDCVFNSATGMITVKYIFKIPAAKYAITVTNGTASKAEAEAGETITLTANAAPAGKEFDKWVVAGATVADAASATTTFTMPAAAVAAEATYKDKDVTPPPAAKYAITVTNGTASKAEAEAGETITLTANAAPAGKEFDKWVVAGATVADAASATTTFTMPAAAVAAEATYKDKAVTPPPAAKYAITVTNGTASKAEAEAGETITLTANAAPAGKKFDKWVVAGATVADATKATTTFTMPAAAVAAEATYKDKAVVPAPVFASLEIKAPSKTKINYKDGIVLHATAENLPAGAEIEWTTDNGNFATSHDNNGNLTAISKSKGDTTFIAKIKLADGTYAKDANGNEIVEKVTINSNAGFFQKIIGFFKGLFGLTKIYDK